MGLFQFFNGRPQCKVLVEPYVSDKHLHEEIELVYTLSGPLSIRIQQKVYTAKKGQIICIPSNALHQYMSKNVPGDVVIIKFIKDWLVPPFLHTEEKEAYHRLFSQIFITNPDPDIKQIIQRMLHLNGEAFTDYLYFGKLIELAGLLLSKPEAIALQNQVNSESLRYVEEATKFIQDHCTDKLTLKMLADYLGLSENYCSKYIKKNFGISFVEYLNATRVNYAQRLLLSNKNSSITEVAEQAGFFSVQTFNRVFRKQTNQSPTEYRSKM